MLLLRVIDSSGVSSSCALYGPLLTFGSLAPACAARNNSPLDKATAVNSLPAPSRRKRRRSAYTSGAVISEGKTSCRDFILINISRPPLLSWGLVIRPHLCGAVASVRRHRAAILAGEVYRTYPHGCLGPATYRRESYKRSYSPRGTTHIRENVCNRYVWHHSCSSAVS